VLRAAQAEIPMSKRINIMIDDDTWRVLGRIPVGARSRAINEAIRAWVTRRRRNDAVRELDELRTRLPAASTAEIAQWIRAERGRGH
jgi:Arc/MetJ family transcription regulator